MHNIRVEYNIIYWYFRRYINQICLVFIIVVLELNTESLYI